MKIKCFAVFCGSKSGKDSMYEKHATPMMNQNKLFPVFMIRHAF